VPSFRVTSVLLCVVLGLATTVAAQTPPAPQPTLEIQGRQGEYYWVVETAPDGSRRGGWVSASVPLDRIDRSALQPIPALPAPPRSPVQRAPEAAAHTRQSVGRIPVFVSAPTKDGFVDADNDVLDSVKDLRSRLSKIKEFTMVDRREAATVVLTVLGRGLGAEAYGQRIRYSDYLGPQVTNEPMVAETYWIATRLDVGDYHRPVVGTLTRESFAWSAGAWSYCADKIVKDVRTWAQANAETLEQKKP
jgi:hypothetical protein